MLTLTPDQIASFREAGYFIARKVFNCDEIVALRAWYDQIVDLAAQPDLEPHYRQSKGPEVHIHIQAPGGAPEYEARYLRKVQWPAMFHAGFEKIRTSPKLLALVRPLLGDSLKQYINQINFKMPGGGIAFPWHQDVRPTPAFRDQVNNYVQTIIVVDDATVENGCLHIVPGSHRDGNLNLRQYTGEQKEAMFDDRHAAPCLAEAGDVVMFTSYTVHGSRPNRTDRLRGAPISTGLCGQLAAMWASGRFWRDTPCPLRAITTTLTSG